MQTKLAQTRNVQARKTLAADGRQPAAHALLIRSRAHYVDITGEIDVILASRARDAEAKAAGTVICPSVGFDVLPTDCLLLALKEAMPDATHLILHIAGFAEMSPGTMKTAIEGIATATSCVRKTANLAGAALQQGPIKGSAGSRHRDHFRRSEKCQRRYLSLAGLITDHFLKESFIQRVQEYADRMSRRKLVACAETCLAICRGGDADISRGLALEMAWFVRCTNDPRTQAALAEYANYLQEEIAQKPASPASVGEVVEFIESERITRHYMTRSNEQ